MKCHHRVPEKHNYTQLSQAGAPGVALLRWERWGKDSLADEITLVVLAIDELVYVHYDSAELTGPALNFKSAIFKSCFQQNASSFGK